MHSKRKLGHFMQVPNALGHIYEFVALYAKFPLGVRFDVVDDQWEHL
jgi:hypothetical protein